MRVARELNLHAMTKVGHASSRLVVSQGLGVWDSGIRFVVAVVVAFEVSTLISGLRGTIFSAAMKLNMSALLVGETPTLNSAF